MASGQGRRHLGAAGRAFPVLIVVILRMIAIIVVVGVGVVVVVAGVCMGVTVDGKIGEACYGSIFLGKAQAMKDGAVQGAAAHYENVVIVVVGKW